jgi:hypothetical protein
MWEGVLSPAEREVFEVVATRNDVVFVPIAMQLAAHPPRLLGARVVQLYVDGSFGELVLRKDEQ